ncbi:MAG: diguanylate cyclase [Clostridia bacterium]|nr:diguanylate cyclase [Clostridia bacterium]
MDYAPLSFSLLFFIAFAVYLFFGIYIIHLDSKSYLNRLFLGVCIALCLWSFGFSMANSAPSGDIALFWRRFSALGWASIYSLLLHFFLLLTDENRGERLKPTNLPQYLLFLLYIPAAVNMYLHSLSSKTTAIHYNLIRMDYGWVNVSSHNIWDLFFYAYYAGYILISLMLLWRWKKKSPDVGTGKKVNLISSAILAALFFGSLTDVILSSHLKNPLPQMAPVLTLIPIAAIYYSIKNYSLLGKIEEARDDTILDERARESLYYHLSMVFIASGLLCFLPRFLPYMTMGEESLHSMLVSSIFLFFIGIAIMIIKLMKDKKTRSVLIILLALLSIPLITLLFIEYSSITVWAFPIILMITSLVFDTRIPLSLIMVTAVATQILVWVYAPIGDVQMDKIDFLLRIGMFLIAFWLGSVVNKIYVKRLKENIRQMDFQKVISEISFDFVNVNQENIDEKINNMLRGIGEFFLVDRAYVFSSGCGGGAMKYLHEWCRSGISPGLGRAHEITAEEYPWWMEQLKRDKVLYIDDIDKLPHGAASERARLNRQNIKSLVAIPFEKNDEIMGFIGLDSVESKKKWSDHYLGMLKIFSNLLADGMMKVKAEKEIEYMAYYDRLTGLPNRTLFTDRLDQALHMAKRHSNFVGVMFMDLDNFKTVNDILGHRCGDGLIKKVAHGLKERLRKTDTVARFGGDEFLIMLNNISSAKDITKVADDIMDLFAEPFKIDGRELYITASIGIAVFPYDGAEAETLIKNADIAMYRAKSGGKKQICPVYREYEGRSKEKHGFVQQPV